MIMVANHSLWKEVKVTSKQCIVCAQLAVLVGLYC